MVRREFFGILLALFSPINYQVDKKEKVMPLDSEDLFLLNSRHTVGEKITWANLKSKLQKTLPFLQSGRSAVATTVERKLREKISVKDFGAVGDGVHDDTVAIQAAIDSLDMGVEVITGGIIFFPRGTYLISSPVFIRTTFSTQLSSLSLRGEGMHNTLLSAATMFVGDSMISMVNQSYVGLYDLHLHGHSSVANGVAVIAGNHMIMERVLVQYCKNNGFLFQNGFFMLTMTACRSKGSQVGFNFSGFHTSLNISNCYALNNTSQGFRLRDVTYSSFTSCAADHNLIGYYIQNTGGVVFNACGAEESGKSAFYFHASAADDSNSLIHGTRATLSQCVSVKSDLLRGGFGAIYSAQIDTSVIDVVVDCFYEFDSPSGISVATNGVVEGHKVELRSSRFNGKISGYGAIQIPSIATKKAAISVAKQNTPIVNVSSLFKSTTQYSGILHIIAGHGDYTRDVATEVAAYVLLVSKTMGVGSAVLIAQNGFIHGASVTHPAFTWALDTTSNQLLASPVGKTSGSFYFYISQLGGLNVV